MGLLCWCFLGGGCPLKFPGFCRLESWREIGIEQVTFLCERVEAVDSSVMTEP